MIKQYIVVADDKWDIYIYYNTNTYDADEIMDILLQAGCPYDSAEQSVNILTNQLNTGMTFTNMKEKVSRIFLSMATSKSQMFNTAVHELKHVQSHICEYYNVDESGEQAAYLIVYIARRVYKILQIFI